jgi:hypothetical protein
MLSVVLSREDVESDHPDMKARIESSLREAKLQIGWYHAKWFEVIIEKNSKWRPITPSGSPSSGEGKKWTMKTMMTSHISQRTAEDT